MLAFLVRCSEPPVQFMFERVEVLLSLSWMCVGRWRAYPELCLGDEHFARCSCLGAARALADRRWAAHSPQRFLSHVTLMNPEASTQLQHVTPPLVALAYSSSSVRLSCTARVSCATHTRICRAGGKTTTDARVQSPGRSAPPPSSLRKTSGPPQMCRDPATGTPWV